MSTICVSCDGKISNTGIPVADKPFGLTQGIYIVPLVANDGTRNKLVTTSATLGADFLAMVNNADPSKRAFPVLGLSNFTDTQADTTFETDDIGRRSKIRDGIRTVSCEKRGVTEQFFGHVENLCVEAGLYLVDECGNLKGELDGTDFYPRPIHTDSYDANFMITMADSTSKVVFTMDWDFVSKDKNQYYIKEDAFTNANPLLLKGMIDVNLELSAPTTTTVVVKAYFDYGPANALIPFTGAALADFSLYNQTDDAAVVPSGVVESVVTPGTYTITFPLQTVADVIEVDVFRAATGERVNGYEGVPATFTI